MFRDLGHKNADAEQFKAILAAEISKALGESIIGPDCAEWLGGLSRAK